MFVLAPKPHPNFTREGANLVSELNITLQVPALVVWTGHHAPFGSLHLVGVAGGPDGVQCHVDTLEWQHSVVATEAHFITWYSAA